MSYHLRKQFGSLIPILKRCYNPGHSGLEAKYSRFMVANASELKPLSKYNVSSNQIRKVSSSNLAKSKTDEKNPKNESKNVMDDDEFRSILSDFAKDFGVGSDSEPILDEIRKSIDDPLNDSEKSSEQDQKETLSDATANKKIPNIMSDKFKEYSESDSLVIPSYEELQDELNDSEYVFHIDSPKKYEFSPEQLKRGVSGVYDIGELIEVLRKENLADITTISVPKELHYTDFLVIATAKSPRHSRAVCEHVIKLYKMKKHLKDPFVIVEGEKTSDWKAIDMGNIVLHIFLEETRLLYDIESLWLFDSAFDRGGNQKADPLYNAIEEQMAFFTSLNESFTKESPQKTV